MAIKDKLKNAKQKVIRSDSSRVKNLKGSRSKPDPVKSKGLIASNQDMAEDQHIKEHRKEALKLGRRHKKPLKRAKFRVMMGSLLFVLISIGIFLGLTFYALQVKQSYSNLAYSASKITPFNASSVDDNDVSYEEYLFILRQSVHYLVDFKGSGAEQIDINTEDGQKIIDSKKIKALKQAEGFAYSRAKAKELNITVSKEEVSQEIDELLRYKSNSTREELETTLRSYYDWTFSDYERYYTQVVLQRKVLTVMDDAAASRLEAIAQQVESGQKLDEITTNIDQQEGVEGGYIGLFNLNFAEADLDQPDFSHIAVSVISNLEEGQISEPIATNDSFFIFQNVKTHSPSQKELYAIRIDFRPIDFYMAQMEQDGKINRNINLRDVNEAEAAE